jgi:hypothetical protein
MTDKSTQGTYYFNAKHAAASTEQGSRLFSKQFQGYEHQYTLVISLDYDGKVERLKQYQQQWGDVIDVGIGDLPGILQANTIINCWNEEKKCYQCDGRANSEVVIIKVSRRGEVLLCNFCKANNKTYLIREGDIPIFVDQYGVCQDGCFFFRAYSNSKVVEDILAKNLKYQRDFKQACFDLNVLAKSLGWIEIREFYE